MLENIKKLLFDAYCAYYESEDCTPKAYRANGAIATIKRLLRAEYEREKANEIIKEQANNARYIVYGDNE